MNLLVRWVLILFLLFISLAASIFIVIESGTFYQQFYHQHLAYIPMGYCAAALNEIFMAVMAATWLPVKFKKKKQITHPANYLFKFLLVILFVTTVGGASFNSVSPLIGKIQKQNNTSKIISVLEAQVNDADQSFETFKEQNQKTNTALAARNQVKIKEELKSKLGNIESTSSLWFQIGFIILLRLGVQLANLCCVWLAGWLYRSRNELTKTSQKKSSPKADNQVIWKEKHSGWYGRQLSLETSQRKEISSSSTFSGPMDIIVYRENIKNITEQLRSQMSQVEICRQLEISSEELSEIINHKNKFNSSYTPQLKTVYEKLTRFQNQQLAVS